MLIQFKNDFKGYYFDYRESFLVVVFFSCYTLGLDSCNIQSSEKNIKTTKKRHEKNKEISKNYKKRTIYSVCVVRV